MPEKVHINETVVIKKKKMKSKSRSQFTKIDSRTSEEKSSKRLSNSEIIDKDIMVLQDNAYKKIIYNSSLRRRSSKKCPNESKNLYFQF